MASRTDFHVGDVENPLFRIRYTEEKKQTCNNIGRTIALATCITCATITGVSFVASLILGCVAAATPYFPLACFVCTILSLALLGVSGVALVGTIVSGVVLGIFDARAKGYN